jgi:hypothetical protein
MTKKGQRVKLKKHRKLKMSINGTYQNPGKCCSMCGTRHVTRRIGPVVNT